MFEACGSSRNRASQLVDPDCAAAEMIKPAHAAIANNTHQRRRIGSSCVADSTAHDCFRRPPALKTYTQLSTRQVATALGAFRICTASSAPEPMRGCCEERRMAWAPTERTEATVSHREAEKRRSNRERSSPFVSPLLRFSV